MPEPGPAPIPIERVLRDLLAWFRTSRVRGVIIGGVAVSLLAKPRMTRDVDAMVILDEERWGRFLEAGKRFGLRSRTRDPIAFARLHRVLPLVHEPTGTQVDCSLGRLRFEKEAVRRRILRRGGGLSIPLPRPEDLVVMKAVAGRPQDRADIAAIVGENPHLRLDVVRRELRGFAEAFDLPGLLEDFEILVHGARRTRGT